MINKNNNNIETSIHDCPLHLHNKPIKGSLLRRLLNKQDAKL